MKKHLFAPILAAAIMLLLTGCFDKEPQPEERLAAYTKLWNEQNFTEMYTYLSKDTKKNMSKAEFAERYEKIYKGIEAKQVKVTYKQPTEEQDHKDKKKVALPFSVSMNSVAGEINFDHKATLVKEEREDETNWYVKWDPSYIFPELEEGEKVSVKTYPAIRGEIVDRNERGLAMNGSVYEVGIVPEEMAGNEAGILSQLSSALKMSKDEIENKLNQSWVQPNYLVPIKKLSLEDTTVKEKVAAIQSVTVNEVQDRVYPYKEVAAHLIGYIGDVSAEDLKANKDKGYTAQDEIGKRGLEQLLEDRLKGKAGAKVYIAASSGEEKVIADQPAAEGETITLTIDAELQKQIYQQYKNENGSAAAINPITGETLALMSSPSFDPNQYILGISNSTQKAWEENPDKPLLNRFSSVYAPGSTIKALTGSIAMKNGVDPKQAIKISGTSWKKSNWKDHSITRVATPGKDINMTDGMIYSDNIYFAQKALNLGTAKFTKGLKDFGFEETIPYDYPITKSGIGTISSEGRLADSGYGQGQIQMSTLHLALTYSTYVNQGNMISPVLLDGEKKSQVWKKNVVSEKQAASMLTMLEQVVQHPKGSGHTLDDLDVAIAGKTGTAETKLNKGSSGTENGWFVGVNTENPQLLMSWMVEDVKGRGGSHFVVDKMKPVWKKYFKE